MGFLESYLRLPRYQRVVLGLAGVALGWYGPSLMQYLFEEPHGLLRFNKRRAKEQLVGSLESRESSLSVEQSSSKDN